jgi:hypothetical protein
MLDITSSKVAIPSVLFLALSPGVLLQIPSKNGFMSGKTSKQSVVVHAIAFAILYSLVARQMGLVLVPNDIIVPTILFMLLSPGMIFSLPSKEISSGQTNLTSAVIHALVFAIVFAFLRKSFPQYY